MFPLQGTLVMIIMIIMIILLNGMIIMIVVGELYIQQYARYRGLWFLDFCDCNNHNDCKES